MKEQIMTQSVEVLVQNPIEQFDLNKLVRDEAVLGQVTDLYIRAFREPPWNEDFHTKYSVLLELAQELSTPGAAMFVKKSSAGGANEDKVVAFGWGYPSSSSDALAKAKYTGDMVATARVAIDERVPSGIPFWYTSEVVTDPNTREKGFATAIVRGQEEYAKKQGLDYVVLRTTSDSPMNYIAGIKAEMTQIIGPNQKYKDMMPRYEQRVLYVKHIRTKRQSAYAGNMRRFPGIVGY